MEAAGSLSYPVTLRPRLEWGCHLLWLGFVAILFLLRMWLVGDLWLTAILTFPLVLFSRWSIRRGLEQWVEFSTRGVSYVNGRRRVEVEYGDMEQVTVCMTAGFDANTRYWMLLLLAEAPPTDTGAPLSTDFIRWMGVEQAERILPLDISRFDTASVAEMMALFFRRVPQVAVKPHPWSEDWIPALRAGLQGHRLDLEQLPDSHHWKVVG